MSQVTYPINRALIRGNISKGFTGEVITYGGAVNDPASPPPIRSEFGPFATYDEALAARNAHVVADHAEMKKRLESPA